MTNSGKRADLTQENVTKSLIRLTAPMLLGVSSSILVQMIELVFIAQLGTMQVAAVTFTFPVTMALTSIALGIGIGTSSVVARKVGGGEEDASRILGQHAIVLVSVVTVALAVVLMSMTHTIFEWLGAEGDTLREIDAYMSIYLPGTVLFTITMVAGNVMRANGLAGIPGLVMTLGAGLNLLLDPFFIFGLWGFPELGLQGAAVAMAVSRAVTAAVLLYYVVKFNFVDFEAGMTGFINSSRQILHIGLPAMATQLIGPVSIGVITALLATYGESTVAGFGVAARVEAVSVMFLFALSGSIGPFVGQNYGAKKNDRVTQGLYATYKFSLGWGFLVAVALFFLSPWFVPLIESDPKAQATAITYLRIAPWSYGAWGILMMASASFNALGKPLPSTMLAFTRMFLFYIPLAFFLTSFLGYAGVFTAALATNLLLGALGWLWFSRWFNSHAH